MRPKTSHAHITHQVTKGQRHLPLCLLLVSVARMLWGTQVETQETGTRMYNNKHRHIVGAQSRHHLRANNLKRSAGGPQFGTCNVTMNQLL